MSTDDDPNTVDAEALAQPSAERLAEDESLRGSLTDIGYGPLLDWLTNLLIAASQRIARGVDPGSEPKTVIDRAGDAARRLGQALVAASEQDDITLIRTELREPLLTRDQILAARDTLSRPLPSQASPDDRARLIVAVLAKAIGVGIEEEEDSS